MWIIFFLYFILVLNFFQMWVRFWLDSLSPLSYTYYWGGRVGFVWFNFVGDFVSYCFPSCYVMYTCISSANKIIYANKTIDIMKVIEMFTFFRSF